MDQLAARPWHEHYRGYLAASKSAASKPAASTRAAVSPRDGQPPASQPGASDAASPASDPELVARMVQGDRTAVAELYERHKLPLFALARSMRRSAAEAEDLLHDVFLEAWRRSGDYSAERGSVRAWLMLRTRSRALDRIKSAGRPRQLAADAAHESAVQHAAPETGDQRRLRELLVQMPEGQRQVVLLGYFEGLCSAEIGERLGIPVGTVKSRTRAALESLRDVLGKGHD